MIGLPTNISQTFKYGAILLKFQGVQTGSQQLQFIHNSDNCASLILSPTPPKKKQGWITTNWQWNTLCFFVSNLWDVPFFRMNIGSVPYAYPWIACTKSLRPSVSKWLGLSFLLSRTDQAHDIPVEYVLNVIWHANKTTILKVLEFLKVRCNPRNSGLISKFHAMLKGKYQRVLVWQYDPLLLSHKFH